MSRGPDPGTVCCFITVALLSWPTAFVMSYYNIYADVYPLSLQAAHIQGAHHVVYEVFRWILSIVGCLAMSFLAVAAIGSCMDGDGCDFCQFVVLILPVLALKFVIWLPVYLSLIIRPRMADRAWNAMCDEWEIQATLNGSTSEGLNITLGIATVVLSTAGNYTMQLIANSAFNLSFSVVDSFNYTPPISTIVYNNESLIFTTDNATSGHYIVTPQLSFPSLNLESTAPDYINFETEGGPALALLSYNRTMPVLYTVNTKPGDFSLLRVCGSLEPIGDFQIAMGVVLMQQYLDTLYQSQIPVPSDEQQDE